jgi:Cu(I)/Ag(I) efflux system membrane fusion protein
MTGETRKLWIVLAAGVVLGAALIGGALTMWRSNAPPHEPSAEPASSSPGPQHDGPSDAATSADLPNSLTLSLERLQSIGVRFEILRPRPLERTIKTVGRVEVDERLLAHVNVKLEGWIEQLYVNYTGERVRKGQMLFTLYSPELVATQQEYLIALRGRSRLGSSDFPDVAESSRALLDVTRQRLRLWDIQENHIRDLEQSGVILKTLPIHSPVNGTVMAKTAVVGLHVNPGEELYTIADLSKVWVQADIFENELPLIAIGQVATVTPSHSPGMSFQAVARFIYPTVNPETRTAKVRFELDNVQEQLKPGMFTNLELKIQLGTRLVVPREAVLETGKRQLIFLHHGGGRLEWREVKSGLRADDWIEILEGVKEGDHIVTSSNFLIDSESQLKAAMGGMIGMSGTEQ